MTEEQLRKKWPMDDIPDEVREFAVAWGAGCDLFIRDTVKLARDILELYEKMRGKELLKPHQESREQYLKWLDEEIIYSENSRKEQDYDPEVAQYCLGHRDALLKAKEKFIQLTKHQSINNDIPDNNVRL